MVVDCEVCWPYRERDDFWYTAYFLLLIYPRPALHNGAAHILSESSPVS